MAPDEVSRLELGRGPRRWWPFVVAGLAAWAVAVVVVGGGDGEPVEPPPASTTTTVASTTTAPPGPLLGGATGLSLVIAGGVESRLVDLDSGAVMPFDPGLVVASRPDGLVTARGGRLTWWPAPFAEGAAVDIGPSAATAHTVRPRPEVWLVEPEPFPRTGSVARLRSLADGAEVVSVPLPPGAAAVGTTSGGSLVVQAGGDGFVLGGDGSRRPLDGAPEVVVGDLVVLRACDADLRCGFVGADAGTGATRALPALDADRWRPGGPTSDGEAVLALVEGEPDGLSLRAVLVTPDGLRPALPPELSVRDRIRDGAWTPDGRLLVVPFANEVHAVDPFAPDGPVTVATFALDPPPDGQLFVVAH